MIEGNAQEWIAVGYTPNKDKRDADVFVCMQSGGHVSVIDAYYIPNDQWNVIDSRQDLCPFSMSLSNGRIKCVFSRAIQTNDIDQDLVLDGSYYQLTGGKDAVMFSETVHNSLKISIRQAVSFIKNSTNSTTSNTTQPAVLALIRAHGILMIAAWPTVYVTSNVFSILMQPADPGTPQYWARRVAQVITFITGLSGAVCIFVARKVAPALGDFKKPEVAAHFVLGIILIVLNILNPILSCTPRCCSCMREWMIKIVLVPCAILGVILSLINIAIGLSLFEDTLNVATVAPFLAVFLAYICFFFLFMIAGLVFYTSLAIIKGSSQLAPSVVWPLFHISRTQTAQSLPDLPKVEVAMVSLAPQDAQVKSVEQAPTTKIEDHSSSKDSPLKWAGITVYVLVTIPLMVAVIILVAVLQ